MSLYCHSVSHDIKLAKYLFGENIDLPYPAYDKDILIKTLTQVVHILKPLIEI